jgi:hypothetical protein
VYPAMFGHSDPQAMDRLVHDTAKTWREREQAIKTQE